jgi:hypothetical protein
LYDRSVDEVVISGVLKVSMSDVMQSAVHSATFRVPQAEIWLDVRDCVSPGTSSKYGNKLIKAAFATLGNDK